MSENKKEVLIVSFKGMDDILNQGNKDGKLVEKSKGLMESGKKNILSKLSEIGLEDDINIINTIWSGGVIIVEANQDVVDVLKQMPEVEYVRDNKIVATSPDPTTEQNRRVRPFGFGK